MKNAPSRDTIILWSAVIAGIGLLALLVRHAAIYRFGTDTFTGNVLFGVIFILLVGLYLGFQSVIEDFSRAVSNFFRRKEAVVIAETTSGEQIAVPTSMESEIMEFSMQEYSDIDDSVIIAESPVPLIITEEVDIDDVVFANLEDNIREYGSLEERREARGKYPYFDYYLGDFYHDEASLETLYEEWYELQPKHIKKELDLGIRRVPRIVPEVDGEGCFVRIARENRIKKDDGKILIEEWEENVYITADGDPLSGPQIEELIKAPNIQAEYSELQDKLLSQHHQCNAAHEELKEEDMKYSLAQIGFLCAYITTMMQPYLEAEELQKLHHNAKIWTVHEMPPFTPVNLRSNHLTKEDLKHLGYNVGKFLRLQGGIIARFVKKVFEKPFESTAVKTIEQKLRESKSTKERIPIHTADQMDKLFAHFQRYGNINLSILNKK